VVTIITDAEMGVRLNPLKKVKHVKTKSAAAIIRGKSLRAIFSFGINNQDKK
jgi:hypothetical protein